MSHARTPTPAGLAAPVGLDAALQAVGARLSAALPWLDKLLGRAYPHRRTGPDGKAVTFPAVWDTLRDYLDAMPNDAVRSQAFFTVADPVVPVGDWLPGAPSNQLKAPCSLIVWVNLSALDPERAGPWQEELLLQVRDALAGMRGVLPGRHYQTPAEVLRGFTLPRQGDVWAQLPYAGFRMDFELVYSPPC